MFDSESFSTDAFSTEAWEFGEMVAEVFNDWLLRTRRRLRR